MRHIGNIMLQNRASHLICFGVIIQMGHLNKSHFITNLVNDRLNMILQIHFALLTNIHSTLELVKEVHINPLAMID